MKTRLFVNWYTEKKQPRGKELNRCIENNFRCKYIDEIVNLSDTPLKGSKIKNVHIGHRPTFYDFLKLIAETAGPDDMSIIANLDIYFDKTIVLAKSMAHREAYALTRWDVWDNHGNDVTFLNREDSQDCWIFKGPTKVIPRAKFTLGVPGCDNSFAHLLKINGYKVTNPSLSIKTYHVHLSGTRHFMKDNKVIVQPVPRPYLLLQASEIKKPQTI